MCQQVSEHASRDYKSSSAHGRANSCDVPVSVSEALDCNTATDPARRGCSVTMSRDLAAWTWIQALLTRELSRHVSRSDPYKFVRLSERCIYELYWARIDLGPDGMNEQFEYS